MKIRIPLVISGVTIASFICWEVLSREPVTPKPRPDHPVAVQELRITAPTATVGTSHPAADQQATDSTAVPDWQARIQQVLEQNWGASDESATETATTMINLLPALPAEGQIQAAQHIANLLPDRNYDRILPLLRNAWLPSEVQSILLMNLRERPDAIRLPFLFEIMKTQSHPMRGEAYEVLRTLIGQDFGDSDKQWMAAISDYLVNPKSDEEANTVPLN